MPQFDLKFARIYMLPAFPGYRLSARSVRLLLNALDKTCSYTFLCWSANFASTPALKTAASSAGCAEPAPAGVVSSILPNGEPAPPADSGSRGHAMRSFLSITPTPVAATPAPSAIRIRVQRRRPQAYPLAGAPSASRRLIGFLTQANIQTQSDSLQLPSSESTAPATSISIQDGRAV